MRRRLLLCCLPLLLSGCWTREALTGTEFYAGRDPRAGVNLVGVSCLGLRMTAHTCGVEAFYRGRTLLFIRWSTLPAERKSP